MEKYKLPTGCEETNGKLVCTFEGLDSKPYIQNYNIRLGKTYHFEYHCFESEESCDAELWHHTHQKAKVLNLVEPGSGKNEIERGEDGQPAAFNVEFSDGKKFDVFEDELMKSRKEFYRPDYKSI